MLDLLTHLVEKSLVGYEETPDGQSRYRLLETVRQYSRENLLQTEAAALFYTRHALHFLALARNARDNVYGPEQAHWLDTLEAEHENLRAALDWFTDSPDHAEEGLQLANALHPFWQVRGHLNEGRERTARMLEHPGAQEPASARANLLNGAGILAWMQGDFAQARACYTESLDIKRATEDKQGIARSLNNLGLVTLDEGDYDTARAYHTESLSVWRELEDKRGIAGCLNNLGIAAKESGDYAEAQRLYEEALALNREIGNRAWEASNLLNLGNVALKRKEPESAATYFGSSLELYRELGDRPGVALALEGFAEMAQDCRQLERATRLYAAMDALRTRLGLPMSPNALPTLHRNVSELRATLGDIVFEREYAAGYALSWEQAADYALAVIS